MCLVRQAVGKSGTHTHRCTNKQTEKYFANILGRPLAPMELRYDVREHTLLREFVQKSTTGNSLAILPLKREGPQHSYAEGFNPGPELRKKNTRHVHNVKGKDSNDDEFACSKEKLRTKTPLKVIKMARGWILTAMILKITMEAQNLVQRMREGN